MLFSLFWAVFTPVLPKTVHLREALALDLPPMTVLGQSSSEFMIVVMNYFLLVTGEPAWYTMNEIDNRQVSTPAV